MISVDHDLKNVNMPGLAKVLLSGSAGTSFMTLFSYVASQAENEQFREPEVLAMLIRRLDADIKKEHAASAGWVLHYLVGYLFILIYRQAWKRTGIKPGLASGLVLGGISGAVGIAVWEAVFRLHPRPPRIDFKKYYIQLFIAHLVFGAAAALCYPGKKRRSLFPARDHQTHSL